MNKKLLCIALGVMAITGGRLFCAQEATEKTSSGPVGRIFMGSFNGQDGYGIEIGGEFKSAVLIDPSNPMLAITTAISEMDRLRREAREER